MAVENNILAAVLENFRILRIDLDNPLEVDGMFLYLNDKNLPKNANFSV